MEFESAPLGMRHLPRSASTSDRTKQCFLENRSYQRRGLTVCAGLLLEGGWREAGGRLAERAADGKEHVSSFFLPWASLVGLNRKSSEKTRTVISNSNPIVKKHSVD